MSLSKAIEVVSGINEFGNLFQLVKSAVSYLRSQWNGVQEQPIQEHEVLQLQSDLQCLSETLPAMYNLIDRAEWKIHERGVGELLPKLKDALYDAEDLLDEFRWYELKVSIEGKPTHPSPLIEFYLCVTQGSFNKVADIQKRLSNLSNQLEKMGLHEVTPRFDKSVRPVTTSFRTEPKIFGRENEMEGVIRLLGISNHSSSRSSKRKRTYNAANNEPRTGFVPVLPIVGMGGVGKTTLAQEITTLQSVKSYFDNIIWICVSDDFDEVKFTKVLIKSLSSKEAISDNFDDLQKELVAEVGRKRFLLILDDIWPDALEKDELCWRKFCAPLKNVCQGSILLVTTRFQEVADKVGTMESFALEGLKDEVFWEFFKLCVFGDENSHIDPQLELIGKSILPKLKGTPLAAKTIGRLLRKSLKAEHWNDILSNDLWQLPQKETDILPALRLSYMYLPLYLKRCFSFCAVYPKDYNFKKDTLAEIWVAEGFIEPQGNTPLQHIGVQYFEDLVNLSFFQRHRGRYVIHDLMHDMAQLVSKDECFILKNASDFEKLPRSVRHISILASSDVKPSNLLSIRKHTKLRSLLCNKSLGSKTSSSVIDFWFSELRNLRVLSCASMRKLPESIINLKLLRYLEISTTCPFYISLPSSFYCLYNLQILYARKCKLYSLSGGFSKMINLQKFEVLVPQEVHKMEIDAMGKEIMFINRFNKITRDLIIYNIGATSKNQLAEVELKKMEYLNSLSLKWSALRSAGHNEIEVLQALHPPTNLKSLHLDGYPGEYLPSWRTSSIGTLSLLTDLTIRSCSNLQNIDVLLTHEYLPAIRKICLSCCPALQVIPGERFGSLRCLEDLEIVDCPRLNWQSGMVLPVSLQRLSLRSCGDITAWFPSCLENLTLLESLEMVSCERVVSIPGHLWRNNLPSLKALKIMSCPDLVSIGGSDMGTLSFFIDLTIRSCSNLQNIDVLLTHEYLPAIRKICVSCCPALQLLRGEGFGSLRCLEDLEIVDCPRLNWQSGMVLPVSLQRLSLRSCGDITAWFPSCLENLTLLESLEMVSCERVVSIPGHLWRNNLPSLKALKIMSCPDLVSIGGADAIAHIGQLSIKRCAKLDELNQLGPIYLFGLTIFNYEGSHGATSYRN